MLKKAIIFFMISLAFSCTKQEIREGRILIKKNLKAPNSASFDNEKIILKEKVHDGTWYFYTGDTHAQNSFGAMIRSHYCVVFKIDSNVQQLVFYPQTSVSECNNPPSNIEIEIMKQSNFWGSTTQVK